VQIPPEHGRAHEETGGIDRPIFRISKSEKAITDPLLDRCSDRLTTRLRGAIKEVVMLRYLAWGLRDFVNSPVPPTRRLNWEFYAVISGSCGPCFPARRSPPIRSMALWLLPPQVSYGWRTSGRRCSRVAFHYSSVPSDVMNAMTDRDYLTVPISARQSKRLIALAKELVPHWQSPHQYSHLVFEKALLELSLLILSGEPQRKDVPLDRLAVERVERAIAWFVVNMSRCPKVEEVAAALHMTGTHLRRLFRQTNRPAPHVVFRSLQMDRATDILATTSGTLEEISAQCGFRSATDFARAFRREFKTTANKWRRMTLEASSKVKHKPSRK
jgi:AraC-like DNA-binding protein